MKTRRTKAISDFIKRVKEERNLSLKAIERNSGYNPETGEGISGNYVNDLIHGRAELTIGKAQALAKGLLESEDLFFEHARGVAPNSTGAHKCSSTCIAKEISELPIDDQKRLRPTLDMLRKEVAILRAAHRKRRSSS